MENRTLTTVLFLFLVMIPISTNCWSINVTDMGYAGQTLNEIDVTTKPCTVNTIPGNYFCKALYYGTSGRIAYACTCGSSHDVHCVFVKQQRMKQAFFTDILNQLKNKNANINRDCSSGSDQAYCLHDVMYGDEWNVCNKSAPTLALCVTGCIDQHGSQDKQILMDPATCKKTIATYYGVTLT